VIQIWKLNEIVLSVEKVIELDIIVPNQVQNGKLIIGVANTGVLPQYQN
jgi:hypothetical protein